MGISDKRDAGRPGIDDHRVLRLDRVVALEALLGVVAGLAFVDRELDAADAAVALVQHRQIVVHAVGDRRARAGERAGAVGEQRHVDRVFGERRRCERERQRDAETPCDPIGFHCVSSSLRPSIGKGQTRSFCFAVRHSCARPCGSTIRTRMIRAPVDHEGQMFHRRRRDMASPSAAGSGAQRDRQQMQDRRPEKGAEDRAEAADDDHEQQL